MGANGTVSSETRGHPTPPAKKKVNDPDRANTTLITFNVVFNKAVAGFAADDILLSGTARSAEERDGDGLD